MADKPLSPEKQLLNLIEQSAHGAGAPAPSIGARPGKVPGPPKPSRLKVPGVAWSWSKIRGILMGIFSFWQRQARQKIEGATRRKRSWSLTHLNYGLTIACVALLLYVMGDTVAGAISLKQAPQFMLQEEAAAAASPARATLLKEARYYMEKVQARDIFRDEKPVDQKAQQPVVVAASDPATSNLVLVGISWSNDPDAIIEDKAVKQTYFLKRGQSTAGGVRVEAIFKDKVVLSHGGKEIELR